MAGIKNKDIMRLLGKNIRKRLADSKELAIIAVPNIYRRESLYSNESLIPHNSGVSQIHISHDLWMFGDIWRGPASSFAQKNINQIFSYHMPNIAKNLNEVNNSTLASTGNARKASTIKQQLSSIEREFSSLQQSYNQLKEDFKRKDEANARACYFIISMGLAKEYSEFCVNNSEFDGWYNACLFKLGLDSKNNKSKIS